VTLKFVSMSIDSKKQENLLWTIPIEPFVNIMPPTRMPYSSILPQGIPPPYFSNTSPHLVPSTPSPVQNGQPDQIYWENLAGFIWAQLSALSSQ
jgi:hypothetical protein